MNQDLRTVIRVAQDGSEDTVRMRELRVGDQFRVVTDAKDDHLFNRSFVVYEALGDAYEQEGIWGIPAKPVDS